MNCAILSTLYIRANGEIPCYDDAGAQITLSHVRSEKDFSARGEFDNHNYRHIREALSAGRAPWAETCNRCAMLRPGEKYSDSLSARRIKTLQVEPTLACALQCSGCSRLLDLQQRRKPHKLTAAVFGSLLRGLARDSYTIDLIEYFGNGELLNNPNFKDFVRTARLYYPYSKQRLVTNGNFLYDTSAGSVHVDEFMISCDGAVQSSYEKYRQGGSIELVFAFMRDIPSEIAGYSQKKIWKYILFEFNDTDEELRMAQSLMPQLGIDELVFVRTHSQFRSSRFDDGSVAFPIEAKGVRLDFTPVQHRDTIFYDACDPVTPRPLVGTDGFLMVDELTTDTSTTLKLKGWVLSSSSVKLEVLFGDELVSGSLVRFLNRADVKAEHPIYRDGQSGFELLWASEHLSEVVLTVKVSGESCPCQEHIYHFVRPSGLFNADILIG